MSERKMAVSGGLWGGTAVEQCDMLTKWNYTLLSSEQQRPAAWELH